MKIPNTQTIERVKSAMLCIQRFQWEQGCAAQALLEYEGLTEDVICLCEAAVIRSAADGRVGVMEKNEAVDDPAAIGEALLRIYHKTQNPMFSDAAQRLYTYLKKTAPRTEDGVLYHFDGEWASQQVWVDAYYMAPPFLCAYGDVPEAMMQIKGYRKYLYQNDKQLLSHIWDDKKKEFGREAFWGVGNGWTMAGLTRVIAILSENKKENRDNLEKNDYNKAITEIAVHLEYLVDYLKEIIDGCIRYQREDGFFHNVLDDPASFVETNVGQMLAYSIFRGVKAGYLDRSYLIYADKARAAAYSMVDTTGFVRGVCGMPSFDSSGIAAEGQAFFILMEAAARDLYQ